MADEENKPKDKKVIDPVQPIESVKNEPKEKETRELCWNCTNHQKNSYLNGKGDCKVCGFKKSELYNLNIESENARQRAITQPTI